MQKKPNPEILDIANTNIEAEQTVLGALFINNSAFLHIPHLKEDHFFEPVHKRIFAAMIGCWQSGKTFTPILLKPLFDSEPALANVGAGAYLVNLVVSASSVTRIAEYADLLIDMMQRRELALVCESGIKDINFSMGSSPAEIALGISIALEASINQSEVQMFRDDYEVTESIMQGMQRDVRPYSTGYSKLDIAMEGGLHPGKSYGFAARKKVGKTILAGSIGSNLNIAGVRHLFICGEMSPEEIQKRTLARLLRVKQSIFNSYAGKKPEFMKRVTDAALMSKRAMIYKNAPGITFEDLKRYVLLARMQKKITGFILDYWQLVGGKPKGKSTAEHLDEVAQWIADTCRKYDLWSIVMAQINQEGNTRGGEGIRLAFDQVYILQSPNDDAGRTERWLEMSDTRYTAWRSVGSQSNPGMYLNEMGPYFSETYDDQEPLDL